MNGTAVAPVPRFEHDLAAFRDHFVARLRLLARDPLALGILALAGVLTLLFWSYELLPVGPWLASRLPLPPNSGFWHFSGTPPTPVRLAFNQPEPVLVFAQLLWVALMAGVSGGAVALARRPGTSGSPMPSLPVGTRARVLAEALAAFAVLLVVRGAAIALGGRPLSDHLLVGSHTYPEIARLLPGLPAYPITITVHGVLGALFMFPLVLAWTTVARFDLRGLLKPALAVAFVFAAGSTGAMAHLGSAVLISTLVTAFVVARIDTGERSESTSARRGVRFRLSPGPLAQLRRDATVGRLRALWLALVVLVVVPMIPAAVRAIEVARSGGDLSRGFVVVRGPHVAFVQWLALLGLTLFPFGLSLVPSRTPERALFGGSLVSAWRALPVPTVSVVRSVYVQALVVGAGAWLLLCAHVLLLGLKLRFPLFELPALLIMPAIAVCEAVGDRRRGLLAVAALAGFQFGVPFGMVLVDEILRRPTPDFGSKAAVLTIAAWVVGAAGALPPLVHLRARSAVH